MKAITLTQPYATLVAIGAKKIETRSWRTRYYGPLLIHAAKGFPRRTRRLCGLSPYREALEAAGYQGDEQLPTGAIVGLVELVGCWRFISGDPDSAPGYPERVFGDYTPGRFGWALRKPHPLPALAWRGALGLWDAEPTPELATSLRRIGVNLP